MEAGKLQEVCCRTAKWPSLLDVLEIFWCSLLSQGLTIPLNIHTHRHTPPLHPNTGRTKASTKAGEAIHLKRAGGGGRENERVKKNWLLFRPDFQIEAFDNKGSSNQLQNPGRLFTPSSPHPPYSSSLYWARGPRRDGISSRTVLKLVSFDRSSVGFSARSAPVWIQTYSIGPEFSVWRRGFAWG